MYPQIIIFSNIEIEQKQDQTRNHPHISPFPPMEPGWLPCPMAQWPNGPMAWQDGTLSIEEIQKGIAESAVEIPGDLIEIMPVSR